MNIFESKPVCGWAVDTEGLTIYLRRPKGRSTEELACAAKLEMLLESGQADAEPVTDGVYLSSHDAVRLDAESREDFCLPSTWPGSLRLDVHGVPNVDGFDAALVFVDEHGYRRSGWSVKGPIVKLGDSHYFPSAEQFACLEAFRLWRETENKGEVEHLRLLHTLIEARSAGCRIDLSSVGKVDVQEAEECVVTIDELPDGSLSLTPTPIVREILRALAGDENSREVSKSDFEAYRLKIQERLGQLGDSGESILRIGSKLILLDEQIAKQARSVAAKSRVPRAHRKAFERDPVTWLAENVFVHGDVEFLPRVIGIGEWVGGYLGASGELGDAIDWFNRQPEAEEQAKAEKAAGEEKDGADNDGDLSQSPDEEEVATYVPLIEKNEHEVEWGTECDRPADPESINAELVFDGFPRDPFPHQTEAIRWLSDRALRCGNPSVRDGDRKFWGAGGILADDMGLGKTLSTLLFLSAWLEAWRKAEGKPAPAVLVVCPLSLVGNWIEEIEKSYPKGGSPFRRIVNATPEGQLKDFYSGPKGKDVPEELEDQTGFRIKQYGLRFGDGTEASLDQPGTIVLTTYATLRERRFSFAGCNWSAVILDEAQNIKNPNSLQTIAAKALKGFFRIALSGTPVENHLGDLWCLMDAVEPGALRSFQEFRKRWVQPIRQEPERLLEIGKELREVVGPLLLRRSKEEALDCLPSKSIEHSRIPMSEEQIDLYEEILEGIKATPDEESQTQRSNRWLAGMWELRRVTLHPDLLGNGITSLPRSPLHSRDYFARSGKLNWLLGLLDEIHRKGEKVLIFAVQKKMQQMLASHLGEIYGIKIPIINGDTKAASATKPNETRLGLLKEFSARSGFGVCVLSPIAAGAGLNIVAANHVIHLERHWNPAKEDQATDRAYRIGQKKDVFVHLPLLVHPNRDLVTFDLGLNKLIDRKRRLAGSLGLIPVQGVAQDELFEEVLGGADGEKSGKALYLNLKRAVDLSWELFEALIAEIYSREAEEVILTSKGRDSGADVLVIGHEKGNLLIQVKTTRSKRLDSEQAVREIEGARPFIESALGGKFPNGVLHTNVVPTSTRTRKAAKLCNVEVLGAAWLSKALSKYQVRMRDVVSRNSARRRI